MHLSQKFQLRKYLISSVAKAAKLVSNIQVVRQSTMALCSGRKTVDHRLSTAYEQLRVLSTSRCSNSIYLMEIPKASRSIFSCVMEKRRE